MIKMQVTTEFFSNISTNNKYFFHSPFGFDFSRLLFTRFTPCRDCGACLSFHHPIGVWPAPDRFYFGLFGVRISWELERDARKLKEEAARALLLIDDTKWIAKHSSSNLISLIYVTWKLTLTLLALLRSEVKENTPTSVESPKVWFGGWEFLNNFWKSLQNKIVLFCFIFIKLMFGWFYYLLFIVSILDDFIKVKYIKFILRNG